MRDDNEMSRIGWAANKWKLRICRRSGNGAFTGVRECKGEMRCAAQGKRSKAIGTRRPTQRILGRIRQFQKRAHGWIAPTDGK